MTESPSEYKIPGGQVSAIEQATAAMTEVAKMVAVYYQTLVDDGVPKELACALTIEYQQSFLDRITKGGQ